MSKPGSTSEKPARSDSQNKIDPNLVREIALLLSETDLTEIEVEKGDLRIRVARQITAAPMTHALAAAPIAAPLVAAQAAVVAPVVLAEDSPDALKSPMVGTIYLRPNPESKPFVEIGSTVSAGQKILLVEAMKTFNDIVAHKSGTIAAILVEDGQPVEYGQALVLIS